MIDVKEIKKLYNVLVGDGIEEIELRSGDSKLSFSIGNIELSSGAKKTVPSNNVIIETAGTQEKIKVEQNTFELRSKWIGFFTRINPKSGDSYIKLRDLVKTGDVIGHVRVLGVLQDIKTEMDGKLKEVLIEEGQPIEYGQPIMRFEK